MHTYELSTKSLVKAITNLVDEMKIKQMSFTHKEF